ncbi:MAG: PTS fructose transporter subunit IIA [Ectothiorhodospiraceae bacterium]|nr:PTS fructose transporter subunit IIA [Ectothiorhodospiraceae bacterium]
MSVGVLLVTHNRIGQELLATARDTMGRVPLLVRTLAITPEQDPDLLAERSRRLLEELDRGDGVLVLTDAFGATPSNIACRLMGLEHVNVVAGVNLPMLLRIFNYPQLPLDELSNKAIAGGRDGVLLVEAKYC